MKENDVWDYGIEGKIRAINDDIISPPKKVCKECEQNPIWDKKKGLCFKCALRI